MNVEQLQAEFRACADAADAVNLARFFKTSPGQYGYGDIFLGIRVPVIRSFVKKYGSEIKLSVTEELLRSEYHEERLLALLIMVHKFKGGDAAVRQAVYELYLANTKQVNNWDLVDLSAEHIVGGWLYDKKICIRGLQSLALSELLWDRRIAIISTFHFIRKNRFDDTFVIAETLLHDNQDLIHKATGWMLREVGNRDRAVEESFLRKHYKEMPRTMLRYAIERFPEPLRLAYLKGTV
jgi:3-methyladenine DNA glycosylase AlkD